MKKRLVTVVVVLLFVVASTISYALSPRLTLKPSEYNLGTSYEFAMKDKKPSILLFYTDNCSYCVHFMPKYKIIEDVYKGKYNFVMINLDDPHYMALVKDYAIGASPTMYIFDSAIDNRVLINNTLYDDLKKIRVELDRYLRIRSMISVQKTK